MTKGKKNGRIRRLAMAAAVTALLCTAFASFAQADDLRFAVYPDKLYFGETGELHINPFNAKYTVEKVNAKEDGFRVIKSSNPYMSYIRSNGKRKVNATLKGTVNSKKMSAKVKIVSPEFTLDGVKGKDIYNVKLNGSSPLTLECNAQKPVKWNAENKSIVFLKRDEDWEKGEETNSTLVYGLKQGKTTITATYMGYKYSVVIQVAPYIPDKSDPQNYLRYLERTNRPLWRKKFMELLNTGKIT